jgi:cytoskeletal protein RodZ
MGRFTAKARLLNRWIDSVVEIWGLKSVLFVILGAVLLWAFLIIRITYRENRLAPPEHPESSKRSMISLLHRRSFPTERPKPAVDEKTLSPTESSETPDLLATGP